MSRCALGCAKRWRKSFAVVSIKINRTMIDRSESTFPRHFQPKRAIQERLIPPESEDAVWYLVQPRCLIIALPCLPSSQISPPQHRICLFSLKLVPPLVVAHSCVSLTAGSILLYSLYAPLFQTHLGFTQLEINAIFISGEIGMYLTVP